MLFNWLCFDYKEFAPPSESNIIILGFLSSKIV